MQKLAPREEQIMQVLWRLEQAFVKEIVAELPEPRPHYNTVSTIVRILEEKGFVGHDAFGNTHRYYPIVTRETYQKSAVGELLSKYFENSYQKLVTYFAEEEKISPKELEEIIRMIKNSQQP